MKKQIIITIILLIACVLITVVYFKNLNTPGMRTSQVMHTIPDNAALIFEFNNDRSFYDIFNDNQLFTSLTGKQKIDDLNALRDKLLQNSLFEKYFTGQSFFISLHPVKSNHIDLLMTISPASGFEPSVFDQLAKQTGNGLVITPFQSGNKQGYNIYVNAIKKRFYVINKEGNIYSGSFSRELIDQSSAYKIKKDKPAFVLLSEQQNANALANIYVNYSQVSPLLDQLFKNRSTDILQSLKLLPGLAALSLNYRSDALMFNGVTTIQPDEPASYLNLFTYQQPVENHLKDIFPATTAYSINFAFSNALKFETDLSQWHNKAGLKNEKDLLFNKIRSETGLNLKTDFNSLLGNEFAVITTRYLEKFAVVSTIDGSKLAALMEGVSKVSDQTAFRNTSENNIKNNSPLITDDRAAYFAGNSGQLNYDKLPFFLLGDIFSMFRHPWYLVIDNYMVLANGRGELESYYDTYINRKFLSKNDQYNQFENLLAGRANVSFFFNFKNCQQIFKRDMYPDIYNTFENNQTGWGNFYAASWQFTSADKNFYTNFCLKLNEGTTIDKIK
ncbi:MAG: hypothetical protein M3N14_04010 [Bacteroidota bacterium]|nr:hypothetical protein [Bacteroidota bacterium]